MEYETRCLDAGVVPHLENWVRSLVSTSSYTERAWRDLSKGRWEARTHGKSSSCLTDLSVVQSFLQTQKPAKEHKRKRTSDSEGQKPKKRTSRKPKGNIIPLTIESVRRLREEEEKEDDSVLVARARASTEFRRASESAGADIAPSRPDEVEEEASAQVPEPRGNRDALPRAQIVEAYHEEGARGEEDPFRDYFVGVEGVTGLSDLEVSKKSSGEVGAPRLFNESQQALKRAFALYHEAFFRSLGEMNREEEAKGLRAELGAAREEQADLAEQVKRIFEVNITDSSVVANSSIPQIQQKFDMIRQLHVEMGAVKAEAEEWKKNMDHLASEKETTRAQLASAETQLRGLKEKALVQVKEIEDFRSRLGSITFDRERLASELAVAKSEVEIATANVDAMMVVNRSDAEAAQVRAKEVAKAAQARANWVAEHAKC
ncbi:uncharacterized protein [Nicotiana tomentosiformis]|uniref:uncharacterized protein n=1 Tax=Nicotiana tomentosiformis TaxID=4098 RepID=UPI00388CCCBF